MKIFIVNYSYSFQILRVESWIFADHEYMGQGIQEWTK